VATSCEHGNDPSVSIKGGAFLDRVIVRLSRSSLLSGISILISYYEFKFFVICLEWHLHMLVFTYYGSLPSRRS
jgi:hypothetical protein